MLHRIPGMIGRLGTAARRNVGTAAGHVVALDSAGRYPPADGSLITGLAAGATTFPGGRLSLQSGVPVMTTTQSAKTTVYWTPYLNQYAPLWNGSSFVTTDMGGELSQATTDATKSPAAVAANSNYDIFLWDDSGTKRCTRGPAWSSGTARGTGAGTSELDTVAGIKVNKVSITNGPSAGYGTYVGTIRSNGSSQIDWIFGAVSAGGTAAFFGLWNAYNRKLVGTSVKNSTGSWTYNSTTLREINATTTNRISILIGWDEEAVDIRQFGQVYNANSSANAGFINLILDGASAGRVPYSDWTNHNFQNASYIGNPGIGFHYFAAGERQNVGTSTYYGSGPLAQGQALEGLLWA